MRALVDDSQVIPGNHGLERDRLVAIGILLIAILFAAGAYLPDVGRGFIKDDFRWILDGAALVQAPWTAFTGGWAGNFFRPVVGFSFGIDHALYGTWARGYGLTNLTLYLGCVFSIRILGRALGLSFVGAAAAALAWAINPNGVDMAVLWLSGRTSLLMTLFSCWTLLAFAHRQRTLGMVCLGLALLSKEDAVGVALLIPVAGWFLRVPVRALLADLVASATVVSGYLLLRMQTMAISIASAPPEYRLTWNPRLIAVNVGHYVDRASTSTLVLALLVILISGYRARLKTIDRRWVGLVVCWFVCGVCITARVPVRSSLYVVFAAIGPALLFGHVLDRLRARPTMGRDVRLVGAFACLLLLIPAINVRTDRWVEPARVSNRALAALSRDAGLASATAIVFRDEPGESSNFEHGLSGVENAAVRLFAGRDIPAHSAGAGSDVALKPGEVEVRLEHGAVRVRQAAR